MKRLWILVIAAVAWNCGAESEDNSALALAVATIAAPNCTVGNQSFYTDGTVDCSSGTSATSTGTAFLYAATTHGEALSVQLDAALNGAAGSLIRVLGHGSGRKATSAAFLEINQNSQTRAGGADNSGGSNTGITANGAGTYCIELHGEAEVHIIYKKAVCAAYSTATDSDWDSEASHGNAVTTGAPAGQNWAITLIDSTVSNLTVNSEESFSD